MPPEVATSRTLTVEVGSACRDVTEVGRTVYHCSVIVKNGVWTKGSSVVPKSPRTRGSLAETDERASREGRGSRRWTGIGSLGDSGAEEKTQTEQTPRTLREAGTELGVGTFTKS